MRSGAPWLKPRPAPASQGSPIGGKIILAGDVEPSRARSRRSVPRQERPHRSHQEWTSPTHRLTLRFDTASALKMLEYPRGSSGGSNRGSGCGKLGPFNWQPAGESVLDLVERRFFRGVEVQGRGQGNRKCLDPSAPLCVSRSHCCSRFPQRAWLLGNDPRI